MFFGRPDPKPLVRVTDPEPSTIKQKSQEDLDLIPAVL
jgi:hypothetical protein